MAKNKTGSIRIDKEGLVIRVESIYLSTWIEGGIFEFKAKQPIQLIREPLEDRGTILFTLSNFPAFGLDDFRFKNSEPLEGFELFVSNVKEASTIYIQPVTLYRFITFRIHRDEFLKYHDIHHTSYMQLISKDNVFSLKELAPTKMKHLIQQIFNTERIMGWHSLMQKSLDV